MESFRDAFCMPIDKEYVIYVGSDNYEQWDRLINEYFENKKT